ncbi:hypothetical protein SAMN02927930_00026 [Pseudidiomarina indica]|uniref:Uncharacterized protein n=1 Tax=Pseudidiomarina indica TaxID=1159017 RepID=A0A1G6A0L8_9GAMM|nr:hypothetical protein [Pseudidiomarina indica]SDB01766.1 hypothetical protein SAMN02927930_00026 [Pseudidiomarina indica]
MIEVQFADKLLKGANRAMVIFLALFLIVAYCAWGLEANLPLLLTAILHFLQILLAGLFKLAYVVRLIAQNQLGQPLH